MLLEEWLEERVAEGLHSRYTFFGFKCQQLAYQVYRLIWCIVGENSAEEVGQGWVALDGLLPHRVDRFHLLARRAALRCQD